MTNGTTKSVEVLMDALSLLHDQRGSLCGMLVMVDAAIQASVAGDPALLGAEELLTKALEMDNPTDKDAQICRARQRVQSVMAVKLVDQSLAALRAIILPQKAKLDAQIAQFQRLIELAAGVRKHRLHKTTKPEAVNQTPGMYPEIGEQ